MSAPSQRLIDVSIGLSVIGWAIAGAWSNLGQRPVAILIVTTLLHLLVGSLFFVRAIPETQGNLRTCLLAVPAVLVGGWVFRFSPPAWSLISQVLFVVGGSLAIASFLFLGRCFAILPAIRGTVTQGPFAIVRHPAYLGELIMVIGCVSAAAGNSGNVLWQHTLILLVTMGLFVIRIRAEEDLLQTNPDYQDYTNRVRWRLIPLVW